MMPLWVYRSDKEFGFLRALDVTNDGEKPKAHAEFAAHGATESDGQGEVAHFDRWLSKKLTQIYGAVLHEPIPDALLDLIEAHRRRTADGK